MRFTKHGIFLAACEGGLKQEFLTVMNGHQTVHGSAPEIFWAPPIIYAFLVAHQDNGTHTPKMFGIPVRVPEQSPRVTEITAGFLEDSDAA